MLRHKSKSWIHQVGEFPGFSLPTSQSIHQGFTLAHPSKNSVSKRSLRKCDWLGQSHCNHRAELGKSKTRLGNGRRNDQLTKKLAGVSETSRNGTGVQNTTKGGHASCSVQNLSIWIDFFEGVVSCLCKLKTNKSIHLYMMTNNGNEWTKVFL